MQDTQPMEEEQEDPAQNYGVLYRWNLSAIIFALVAFYAVIGGVAAALLKNFHASAWAFISAGLALGLVTVMRGKK